MTEAASIEMQESEALRFEYGDVTPELAQHYLTYNTENRNLRQRHVERLASDMSKGAYVANHQGIAFDTEGKLIDGQHRLHAIVQSGVTVQMMIARDVPVEARRYIDTGARRSASDFQPGQHVNTRSAAARILIGVSNTSPLTVSRLSTEMQKVTIADLHRVMDDDQDWGADLARWSGDARAAAKALRGIGAGPLLAAAVLYPNHGDEFLTKVRDGVNLSPGDPALALLRYRVNSGVRIQTPAAAVLCIKVMAAVSRGRSISVLRFSLNEEVRP